MHKNGLCQNIRRGSQVYKVIYCKCWNHLDHGNCERNCPCGEYDQVLMTLEEKIVYMEKRKDRR